MVASPLHSPPLPSFTTTLTSVFPSPHDLPPPQLVVSLPKDLTAQGGIHALSHAIESLTSTFNTGGGEGGGKGRGEIEKLRRHHRREEMHTYVGIGKHFPGKGSRRALVYCPLSCFALQPAECMPMAYLSRQPPSPTCTCNLHAPALPILYCLLPPAVYTRGLSKQAASLIYQYLPRAYSEGASDYLAREKVRAFLCVGVCILSVNAFRKKKYCSSFTNACYLVFTLSSAPCAAHNTLPCPIRQKQQMHYAACIAGMAFSNTMLGVAHSMAATIAAKYKVPHGLALAPLLPAVILFNAAGSEQVRTGVRFWCGEQVWESRGHVSLRHMAAACCCKTVPL